MQLGEQEDECIHFSTYDTNSNDSFLSEIYSLKAQVQQVVSYIHFVPGLSIREHVAINLAKRLPIMQELS